MPLPRCVLSILLACVPVAGGTLDAQTTTPRDDSTVVITGQRTIGGKPIAMSDWRVAETDHLLVYGKDDAKRLAQIARNLEKLHFLLSVLLGRVDQPDDTIKLRVTLIGDGVDFRALDLRSPRWQLGPFPAKLRPDIYYDPREDGAVLAGARADQRIELEGGTSLQSLSGLVPDPRGGMMQSLAGANGTVADLRVNDESYAITAEGRLYAAYARHFLLTYFPAAYPRWYLDGFGEIFATMNGDADGVIEYGRAPPGLRQTNALYGRYPLGDVLNGHYLTDERRRPAWTPFQAWSLAHLLFFSEEWRAPLHRYLSAVAHGAGPQAEAGALGDIDALQRAWSTYVGGKLPYERMTYPAGRIGEPLVRQLKRDEAAFIVERLQLGGRVAAGNATPAADTNWLDGLRAKVARLPGALDGQLLLAEAECRDGKFVECRADADRAAAIDPHGDAALAWSGMAQAGQALAGPAPDREAGLHAARQSIARANRADPEASLPLIAYFDSFVDAGEVPSDAALAGMMKAGDQVPAAGAIRARVGTELARRGYARAARAMLLPVANGAYDSPERAKAGQTLAALHE